MENKISGTTTLRVGDWLPSNQAAQNEWLNNLILEVEEKKEPLHPVIRKFKALIEHDPEVYMLINQMISQVPSKYKNDPLGGRYYPIKEDLHERT